MFLRSFESMKAAEGLCTRLVIRAAVLSMIMIGYVTQLPQVTRIRSEAPSSRLGTPCEVI